MRYIKNVTYRYTRTYKVIGDDYIKFKNSKDHWTVTGYITTSVFVTR